MQKMYDMSQKSNASAEYKTMPGKTHIFKRAKDACSRTSSLVMFLLPHSFTEFHLMIVHHRAYLLICVLAQQILKEGKVSDVIQEECI